MKKIFFQITFIFLIFINQNSLAKYQKTSFDDKPLCEENRGNWREFANSCVDQCSYNFDKYSVCSLNLTFGCDCGENRCWHDDKCVDNSVYQKIFDKENEEKEKQTEAKRKEYQEKIKNDPNYARYMYNLYQNNQAQKTQNQGQNSATNNNSQDFKTNDNQQIVIEPLIPSQPTNTTISQEQKPIKIPPSYVAPKDSVNPINSDGKPQDLVFPVVPLPQ